MNALTGTTIIIIEDIRKRRIARPIDNNKPINLV
jgi:hypothetical protein